jgi:hypothetical protein
MRRRAATCLAAVLASPLGGCGTFFNLIPEPQGIKLAARTPGGGP